MIFITINKLQLHILFSDMLCKNIIATFVVVLDLLEIVVISVFFTRVFCLAAGTPLFRETS